MRRRPSTCSMLLCKALPTSKEEKDADRSPGRCKAHPMATGLPPVKNACSSKTFSNGGLCCMIRTTTVGFQDSSSRISSTTFERQSWPAIRSRARVHCEMVPAAQADRNLKHFEKTTFLEFPRIGTGRAARSAAGPLPLRESSKPRVLS